MAESNHRVVSCDCGCRTPIDLTSTTWVRVEKVYYGATTDTVAPHYLDFVDWSHLETLATYFAANPPAAPGP